MRSENIASAALETFKELAEKFFKKTHEYVIQGIVAFPFRTGISATRIAVANVVQQ